MPPCDSVVHEPSLPSGVSGDAARGWTYHRSPPRAYTTTLQSRAFAPLTFPETRPSPAGPGLRLAAGTDVNSMIGIPEGVWESSASGSNSNLLMITSVSSASSVGRFRSQRLIRAFSAPAFGMSGPVYVHSCKADTPWPGVRPWPAKLRKSTLLVFHVNMCVVAEGCEAR